MPVPSDIQRWNDKNSYPVGWKKRTKKAAKLLEPSDHTVIEFGPGTRGGIRRYLDPLAIYTSADLTPAFGANLILDLNAFPLPALPFPKYDLAVFIGVLEYLDDLQSVLLWISHYARSILLSYAVYSPYSSHNISMRISNGWRNHHSFDILRFLLSQAYYTITAHDYYNQDILIRGKQLETT